MLVYTLAAAYDIKTTDAAGMDAATRALYVNALVLLVDVLRFQLVQSQHENVILLPKIHSHMLERLPSSPLKRHM